MDKAKEEKSRKLVDEIEAKIKQIKALMGNDNKGLQSPGSGAPESFST